MPSLRYIQYARRRSEERSNKQLQSIQGQEGVLEEYARSQGLEVVAVLEESKSAKAPGRPVFNDMIDRLRNGQADAILCWHLDRLTRNEIDSGTIRWLLRNGIIQEIRTPHRCYRPGDSLLVTAVESAIGEQFIVDHIHRVNRGMRQKCANGEIPFRVPQGYLNDRLTKKTVVDPERFPIIQKLFQTVLKERCTVAELHRFMHEQWGYRKKAFSNSTKSELSLNALHNILSNPFYAGYFTWQGEVYIHHLPRAVTKQAFDQVQALLGQRSNQRTKWHDFPYTGLVNCATCGYKVTAEVSKGHTYYHCNNRLGICTKKGIREEALEREVDALLESVTLEPEFEQFALQVLDEMRAEEVGMHQSVWEAQQQTLADLKRQRDALLNLYLQGHLEGEEYAKKKQELAGREAGLKLHEEQAEENLDSTFEVIENMAHFATHARSLFLRGEPAMRRLIAQHVGEYTLNNGELHIELSPLFGPVRSQFKNWPQEIEKIEPSKSGSGSLESSDVSNKKSNWQSSLREYRNLVQERKWTLPWIDSPAPDTVAEAA